MTLPNRLSDQLKNRKKSNSLRQLKLNTGQIDFSSNDYLGLSKNPLLIRNIESRSKGLSIGSTGSRLLSGNSQIAEEVEQYLASIFSSEKCLIVNSGYVANLSVLSSIPQRGDIVFYDELAHASIKDGMRLSLADKKSFKHNDLNDLEKRFKSNAQNKYVVVESTYSMDGDFTPLFDLVNLCERYNARIILDEAHSTGILGKQGGGLSEELELSDKIFCRIFTFGKAMGCHGAAIAGSSELINYLINFARPFIYTTALPNQSYIAIQESVSYLQTSQKEKEDLNFNIKFYQSQFDKHLKTKFNSQPSNHSIQTLLIQGNIQVKGVSQSLQKSGFDVRPILSPTVKEGQERLRICLHSYNTKDEISNLVSTLANL